MPSKIHFSTKQQFVDWLRNFADDIENSNTHSPPNATTRMKSEKVRMSPQSEFEDAIYWGHSLVIHFGESDDKFLFEQLQEELKKD